MASGSSSVKRVVQVIAPAEFGGAETVVRQLLGELASRSIATTTVALGLQDRKDHPWVSELRGAGFDVQCPPLSRAGEYRALRELIRDPAVAAVHSHGYRADFAAFMARSSGVTWVSTAHGYTGGTLRLRLYETVDRWLLGRADRVLAVSSKLRELLLNGGPTNETVRLLRNAPPAAPPLARAAARAALGFPQDAVIAGWVGRFSHEKGADRMPLIFADRSTTCTLALVGDGPLRREVVNRLKELGHLDVRWLGIRRDIGTLLAAFDLLVLPSRTEGMPMAVLEAMVARVPIVAFDVGDVSFAVRSTTGWCVPADDMTAFSQCLVSALTSADDRCLRGCAAAEHIAANFSLASWVEAHLLAYGLG